MPDLVDLQDADGTQAMVSLSLKRERVVEVHVYLLGMKYSIIKHVSEGYSRIGILINQTPEWVPSRFLFCGMPK